MYYHSGTSQDQTTIAVWYLVLDDSLRENYPRRLPEAHEMPTDEDPQTPLADPGIGPEAHLDVRQLSVEEHILKELHFLENPGLLHKLQTAGIDFQQVIDERPSMAHVRREAQKLTVIGVDAYVAKQIAMEILWEQYALTTFGKSRYVSWDEFELSYIVYSDKEATKPKEEKKRCKYAGIWGATDEWRFDIQNAAGEKQEHFAITIPGQTPIKDLEAGIVYTSPAVVDEEGRIIMEADYIKFIPISEQ